MEENNTQAAIDAGKEIQLARQQIQTFNGIPVAIDKEGTWKVLSGLLENQDRRADKPRAMSGSCAITTEASLVAHAHRFRDPESALFATGSALIVVYDYHRSVPDGLESGSVPARDIFARWQRHRAVYEPKLSPEWQTWIGGQNKLMAQAEFADFLEVNDRDIAGPIDERKVPSPADLMTLALTLKVTAEDVLESTINRTTGEYTLLAKQEQKSTGSATIPKEFDIAISVYENGPLYRMPCKFRMRKEGQGFKFGWIVPGAARLLRDAYQDMAKRVSDATALPLFFGSPEA